MRMAQEKKNMALPLDEISIENFIKQLVIQINYITCVQCSKPYTAPTTARCGHTLCRICWSGKKTCPKCMQTVQRKLLMLNVSVHNIKEHVFNLYSNFLLTFKDMLNKYNLGPIMNDEKDPNKYVADWLTNTENLFSPSSIDSQQYFDNSQCVVTSHVQIHNENKKIIYEKNSKPALITHTVPQDDWNKIDKIEEDEAAECNLEFKNMDKSSSSKQSGTTTNSLRRSTRKKDGIEIHSYGKSNQKAGNKNLYVNLESKPHKVTKNNNANIKKEFSKLNKMNKNKLNVSIEMCKKNLIDKSITVNKPESVPISHIENVIENDTPEVNIIVNTDKKNSENVQLPFIENKAIQSKKYLSQNNQLPNNEQIFHEFMENKQSKVPFLRKGALNKNITLESNEYNTINNNPDEMSHLNEPKSDDIEITIKIGSTVTNIYIKRKDNDYKINVDADNKNHQTENAINVNKTSTSCSKSHQNLQDQATNTAEITKSASKIENTTKCSTLTKNISDIPYVASDISKSHEKKKLDLDNIPCDAQLEKTLQKRTKIELQGQANSSKEMFKSTSTTSKSESIAKASSSKKDMTSTETAPDIYESSESIEKEMSGSDNMHSYEQLAKDSREKTNIDSQVQANNAKEITKSTSTSSKNDTTVKSSSSKTNMFSANTASFIYEIPESVEKEKAPADCMHGCEQPEKSSQHSSLVDNNSIYKSQTLSASNKINAILKDKDNIIHNFEVKKSKSQSNKRVRELENSLGLENSFSKRIKITQKDVMEQDSENINYDAIMGQVFANIDADMATSQNATKIESQKLTPPNKENSRSPLDMSKNEFNDKNIVESVDKCSENIFTLSKYSGADSQILLTSKLKTYEQPSKILTEEKENVVEENSKKNSQCSGSMDICTPLQENSSDESFCEETPQKTKSFTKYKSKNETVINLTEKLTTEKALNNDEETLNISLSKVPSEPKTDNDLNKETPGSIAKFVNQIKHKSTPIAKKSLNFVSQSEDIDQTLCNSIVAAKNTQEKQFLDKAFEQVLSSPVQLRNRRAQNLCIAGSCLSASEQKRLKLLCSQRNWTYSNEYTDDLTHLVVTVDQENKSQRSLKYMCALAAGKWIVSYPWVERCLSEQRIVDEERFEALDSSGEPGPLRSRTTKRKLFHNFTFYCKPPFTMLNLETLKNILVSAGARVVDDINHVKLSPRSRDLAILLADPEETEDINYYYLASNNQVVPVIYEWVINCLGYYKLSSINDYLLCPAELILKNTVSWPPELLTQDDE